MQIAVLGAGAMGSLLGGFLSGAGHDVTLVGRSPAHPRAVAERGLTIVGLDGVERTVSLDATTDHAAVAGTDLLVVFVKSYDTDGAMAGVAPHLDGETVLTLQNGLGNAETIAEYVAPERVVAGTTAQGAILETPGRVRHTGDGPTALGRYFAPNDAGGESLAAMLSEAGVETSVAPDVRDAIWEKVLVNVGINAVTALAGVTNGELAVAPAGRRLVERAVSEAALVAEAEGRTVPGDIVARTEAVAEATAANHSSMRQDLEAGRRTEIDQLNGAIVERAAAHDVPTPVNETLADLVRLAESEQA